MIDLTNIFVDIILLKNKFPSKYKFIDNYGDQKVYYWIPLDIFPHKPKKDDVSDLYY